MKKLNLFTQYEPETLFLKAKKHIHDQVGQWPQSNPDTSGICTYIQNLKECVRLTLPEVNFRNGQELLMKKIFPLSEMRPGAKAGTKVRVNVLVFKYEIKGQIFLMGCRPPGNVPDPLGEWFADPVNNEIYIEYKWYERSPRKVLAAHRDYMLKVLQCYNNLRLEFDKLAADIDNLVDEVVSAKKADADRRSQLLSLLEP